MTIANCITSINNTKQAIAASINAKGGSITPSTPFADYSTAIDNLPSGGGSTKTFWTWQGLCTGNVIGLKWQFRKVNGNYQQLLDSIIDATDFQSIFFTAREAFYSVCSSNVINGNSIPAITANFNLDFDRADLQYCNDFYGAFSYGYKGYIKNINISNATDVSSMFSSGSGITELTFKGSFGGENSIAYQPPATMTLDLSPCSALTDQNIEAIVTGFSRNETNCERLIKLRAAHFNNLSQAAADQAIALGYKVISA